MEPLNICLQSFSPALVCEVVVFLLLFYFYFFIFSSNKHGQEPPGPKRLPLIGNLLQLDLKNLDKTFVEFSRRYGSVFTVYMGPSKVVVLAGYQTVKEAFINYAEEFGDRDIPPVVKDANLDHGIAWANGDSWKEMRRFALANLKDFGMGKKACEDKIIEECQNLIQEIEKFKGEPFEMTPIMNYTISNIICSMVFGNRFDYDDPEFQMVVNETVKGFVLLDSPAIKLYNLFPRIGKLLISARKQTLKIFEATNKQHLKLINCLRETLNPQMCRGVADAFMVRQQKESGLPNSHYHDANLLITVMNLFAGGTETSSSTLRWALLFMIKHPKIQDKVQEELNQVIGSRQVQLRDRKSLPFTNAVIHETQRLANIVPLTPFHKTSQDVTFQGHFIEKGTTIIPLLTSVLHDENEWEKPESFHPAHFLDKDGKFLKRDAFMPFSAGRRMCPGESLAKAELFIFFATLLQHFRFTAPPGVSEEDVDLTPTRGLVLSPPPQKVCAVSLM